MARRQPGNWKPSENVPPNRNTPAARIQELSRQCNEARSQLQAEKRRGEMMAARLRASQSLWDAPVDELAMHELEQLKGAVEELQSSVRCRIHEMEHGKASSSDAAGTK